MIDSHAILQSRFVDFDASFRAILPIVLPPINPVSSQQTATPAVDGTAYPPAAHHTAGGDFLPPLFDLSGDSE